jgi:hypothetical protein
MTRSTTGPVVVVMLTHRDPALVRRVVDRVRQGRDVAVVIHHDPRGPQLDLPPSPQVLQVPDPLRASWGRMGLALAVTRSLAYARSRVPEMSWGLVISGQDYPCRPMSAIEDELAVSPYAAYLRWFPIREPAADVVPWQAVARDRYLRRMRLPATHRHLPFPRMHPFRDGRKRAGLGLFIGDMWCNLSAAAIDHLAEQQARHASLLRYLGRCQTPDEALIPTLLLNGGGDLRVANDRKRYIVWHPGRPHPEILTPSDADDVLASGDFFARKVDLARSGSLLDRLDRADALRVQP